MPSYRPVSMRGELLQIAIHGTMRFKLQIPHQVLGSGNCSINQQLSTKFREPISAPMSITPMVKIVRPKRQLKYSSLALHLS